MKPQIVLCCAALLASALAGCGGSEATLSVNLDGLDQYAPVASDTPSESQTTSNSTNDAEPTTGRFLDSAVAGLYYESDSFSGFTDVDGNFDYRPGEYVRFYLGATFLGEALAQAEVTPLDLISETDGPDKLQNMLKVLQTVDADSDPSNGITIDDSVNAYLDQFPLPLNDSAVLFEASSIVQDMVTAVTNGSGLKGALSAFEHFHETLLLSRRQTDEEILLNLMNTTWSGSVRTSACPSDNVANLTMYFTPLGILSTGYHAVDEETCKPRSFGVQFETYETSVTFACANQCLDSDLNRVIFRQDGEAITTLSHQAGSDKLLINSVPKTGASSSLVLTLNR